MANEAPKLTLDLVFKVILNACGPLGLGATFMGWVKPLVGLIIMGVGLAYVLWEFRSHIKIYVRASTKMSLLIFCLCGALVGAACWLAIWRQGPKKVEGVSGDAPAVNASPSGATNEGSKRALPPPQPPEAEEHIEHSPSKPNSSIAKKVPSSVKPIPQLESEKPQPITTPTTSRDATPVGPVTKSPLVYNASGGKIESVCGTFSTGGRTAIENHGEVKSDHDSFDAPSSCSPEQVKIAEVNGLLESSYNTPENIWVRNTESVLRYIFNDAIAADFLAQPDMGKKKAFLKKLKEPMHP